jgi:hypothetical protein
MDYTDNLLILYKIFSVKYSILAVILLSCIVIFSCKKSTPAIVSYKNFKITAITLNQIPFTDNNGSSWDPFNGTPDVFINVLDSNSAVLHNGSSDYRSDVASSALPLTYNLNNALTLPTIAGNYQVQIYDYDPLDANDLIGSISFNPSTRQEGFPSSFTETSGSFSITINGTWY